MGNIPSHRRQIRREEMDNIGVTCPTCYGKGTVYSRPACRGGGQVVGMDGRCECPTCAGCGRVVPASEIARLLEEADVAESAVRARDEARAEVERLTEEIAALHSDEGPPWEHGCGDSSCLIEKPKGMATNGGCRCFDVFPSRRKGRVLYMAFARLRKELELQRRTVGVLARYFCTCDGCPINEVCGYTAGTCEERIIAWAEEQARKL